MRFLPTLTVLLFAALLAAPGASGVAINASVHSFLATYVSNSLISQSTFTSVSYGNSSYLLMQVSPGQGRAMLINVTHGNYLFVLDKAAIATILTPYLESAYFPSNSTLAVINGTFGLFASSAHGSLSKCLTVTGINRLNMTVGGISENNLIRACYTVPICRSEFLDTGADTGPLMKGLLNFSSQYLVYNQSVAAVQGALGNLSAADYASSISQATGAIGNITRVLGTITLNQLFPPPSSITPAQYQNCAAYGSDLAVAPWYCGAVGLCAPITFNTTPLADASSQLASLRSLPVYGSAIASYATQVNLTEQQYVVPTLVRINTVLYDSMLNSTLPRYNTTAADAEFLLGRLDNASLNVSLAALKSTYGRITAAGINQNITAASMALNGAINATASAYARADAVYAPVLSSALNNTASITEAQLNFLHVPAGLALLASSQAQIDSELSGRINATQLAYVSAQTANITRKAAGLSPPLSIAAFVKAIDSPFIGAVTPAGAPVASKMASAPLYAAILSLIIGIMLVLAFYFATYYRLKRKHHIKHTRRTARAWTLLFVLLAALVAVYAYSTYAVAASGNAFLPASAFFSALSSSSRAAIVINSSAATPVNASVLLCAASLEGTLKNFNKAASTILIDSNYSCITGSDPSCYSKLMASGAPIIQLDQGQSAISYRGIYGTVLHASGAPTYGSSCQLDALVEAALSK